MQSQEHTTVYRKDYRPYSHSIDSVELDFVLNPESTTVTSTMFVTPLRGAATHDLVLDGAHDLFIEKVLIDGQQANERYQMGQGQLTIKNISKQSTVTIVNRIVPVNNTSLSGIYMSRGAFMSQCEAQGFRNITYWPDRPDVMSRFTVTIHADKTLYPVLLSNGNLVAEGDEADNRHWVRWEDPFKKPCYLFALVAGQFVAREDKIKTKSGREVLLQVWTEEKNYPNSEHALESLKKAIAWDEERWGLELDLDRFMIVATDDFNFGAMENKGLNIFNSRYVMASPSIATDTDYQNIESIVGHEYFHNWTGDRITLRDWFQLTLKEGLTVFREQEFTADMQPDESSRAVARIHAVRALRSSQFPEDAGPMAHPIRPESYREIDNFYTMTVYEKGAEVIRMLQTLLGKDGFKKGMDRYVQLYDESAVTCNDFIQAMADANGVDLTNFSLWWSQAGTPRVSVETNWNQDDCTFTIRASQSTPPTPGQAEKYPLVIPILVGLIGRDGKDLPLKLVGSDEEPVTTAKLVLETADDEWTFEGITENPVLSLGRGFSAPVIFDYAYTLQELQFLALHDSDGFNRADAFERLMLAVINEVVTMIENGVEPDVHGTLISAFEGILTNTNLSPEYRATVLTLPSEKSIAAHRAMINPQAIRQARIFVMETIGRKLSHKLGQPLHTENMRNMTLEYRFDPKEAGKRALSNLTLEYLLAGGNARALLDARDQFELSDNLTDRLAALRMIVNSQSPAKIDVLNAAGKLWGNEPLLINKWFSVQATARVYPNECPVLDRIKSLMQCPVFSLKNPNNVYALVNTFFVANEPEFHRPDGAGYEFWADMVLQLDSINSHVAARLARALDNWRRYTPELARLMHAALTKVARTENLSAGVSEVVEKALNTY